MQMSSRSLVSMHVIILFEFFINRKTMVSEKKKHVKREKNLIVNYLSTSLILHISLVCIDSLYMRSAFCFSVYV